MHMNILLQMCRVLPEIVDTTSMQSIQHSKAESLVGVASSDTFSTTMHLTCQHTTVRNVYCYTPEDPPHPPNKL